MITFHTELKSTALRLAGIMLLSGNKAKYRKTRVITNEPYQFSTIQIT
jgi:hypothetical protein